MLSYVTRPLFPDAFAVQCQRRAAAALLSECRYGGGMGQVSSVLEVEWFCVDLREARG